MAVLKLTFAFVLLINIGYSQVSYGRVEIEQQEYLTLTVAGKTWLAENLNVKIAGSYCYEHRPSRCSEYHRLYTWDLANKVADQTDGWHLPTDAEWNTLFKAFGGEKDQSGHYMEMAIMFSEGGNTGFNALLAGGCRAGGHFQDLGNDANFWSASSENEQTASYYNFHKGSNRINHYDGNREHGYSVRLVKD